LPGYGVAWGESEDLAKATFADSWRGGREGTASPLVRSVQDLDVHVDSLRALRFFPGAQPERRRHPHAFVPVRAEDVDLEQVLADNLRDDVAPAPQVGTEKIKQTWIADPQQRHWLVIGEASPR
jgi:hypothetical protein